MKKILLIVLGLLLINGLMIAEARAQPGKDGSGVLKITNNVALINSAFSKVFGRDATADEINQWKQSQITRDELIGKLVEFLKSVAGTNELQMTIVRSYQKSFGREPTAKESVHWRGEAKEKGYGFSALIANHNAWLKTPEADSERKSMVFRNHFEVFGRLPTVSESNEWRDEIEKGWGNYSDMLGWNLSQMLNPSKTELLNELHEMIKRAFITAGKGQPSEAQYNEWTAKVKAQRLTFKQLVAILKS